MLKTFAVAFRLRNTYKANSVIWASKGIPLIRRLLPSSLYASQGLKIFAYIVAGFIELFSWFFGKAFYLCALWLVAMGAKTTPIAAIIHMLIFTTIISGFSKTHIFDPTKDKYYAIFIMRMDAKEYTLTDYLYFMLKTLVGFVALSLVLSLLGAPVWSCVALPLYVICVKLCFTAKIAADCKKNLTAVNENKLPVKRWVALVVLLALAALPFLGIALPDYVLWILTALLIVPAVFSLRSLLRFNAYRPVYKELLKPSTVIPGYGSVGGAGAAQQLAMQKQISADMSQTSNKSGYKYFNELFMKRHSKILTRSAKRIALIAAALLAASVVALYIFPQSHFKVNELLMNYLPYFLFLMYLINRGRTITQAMFMNCDHSMLTFRFYRQPKALLSLFVERLKYVIVINLLPAVVIAVGLPLLLYLTGGTPEPLNYVVLFVSIIAMSIFFSVHSMVLYYLLQPYNVNLESKSAAYGIVNWLTYMVSWGAIQVQLPTLAFGSAISAFCILYAVVAVILAYRLAPRTFKLRN